MKTNKREITAKVKAAAKAYQEKTNYCNNYIVKLNADNTAFVITYDDGEMNTLYNIEAAVDVARGFNLDIYIGAKIINDAPVVYVRIYGHVRKISNIR